MENLTQFLKPELLVLVPVLYFVGMGLKQAKPVPDKLIPVLLGAAGVVLAVIYVLAASDLAGYKDALMALFTGLTQGILCAGCSVYVNQIIKQATKEEEE